MIELKISNVYGKLAGNTHAEPLNPNYATSLLNEFSGGRFEAKVSDNGEVVLIIDDTTSQYPNASEK